MSDQGATQQGVPEITDPRDAINAKYEEMEQADLSPVGEAVEWEGEPEEEAPEVKEEKQEAKPAEEPAETTPEVQEPTQPTEQMVRVKVDGVEEEVPLSKVLAQYQKNSAADRRLEEARRAIEEARTLRAEMEALKREKPKEQPEEPTLAPDLEAAFDAIVDAQLEVTDPAEYRKLEKEKAKILREQDRRERAAEVQAWQQREAAVQARRSMEQFLVAVTEKHADAAQLIHADLDAGTVDYDPEFKGWIDTQPPWMKHALLAPDPSGPIYVLDQFKASKTPKPADMDARLAAKKKMDVPQAANRRATPPKDKGDEDDTASYIQQLKEMRAGPRAGIL